MAVKLRLMRMGKKKQPTYRVVAADSRSPRDGRFIEILGTYEPRADPSIVRIDNARAVKWLSEGAQPTERVAKLLAQSGAMEEFQAALMVGGFQAVRLDQFLGGVNVRRPLSGRQ